MKAMIFAAGLGTRLRPLTNDRPKAMVELHGRPLLQIVIERLIAQGIREMVVNVHHFADLVIDFLDRKERFGIKITISDEREQLLETGGGLLKAAPLLRGSEPVLIHNTDVLCDLDLLALEQTHQNSGALATLAGSERETSRYLLWDENGVLCGWRNKKTGEIRLERGDSAESLKEIAFSGIHLIQPEFLDLITQTGKFSIIETYLSLASEHEIRIFTHSPGQNLWMDLGKPEQLKIAHKLLEEEKYRQIFLPD